jgi:putative DNA methylase
VAEYRKKLIEVALPLEAINRESAREKSIRHGHPSTLHLWWARRPLAACRAVLFASIVDDPASRPDLFPTEEKQNAERQRLFRIIEELVRWENLNNKAVLDAARAEILKATDGNPPSVLDPFCGGGSIPLEAQRLGLEAYASDLNPVAVLITKALVEIPPKFAGRPPMNPEGREKLAQEATWNGAQGLAEDVDYYGKWMRDEAFNRIGHLYPNATLDDGREATLIAWIWTRTVKCPNPACGGWMPLASDFKLSTKRGNEAWVEPGVDRDAKTIRWRIGGPVGSAPEPPKLPGKARGFRCLFCEMIASTDYAHDELDSGRGRFELLALVGTVGRGRIYLAPSDVHRQAARQAEPSRGLLEERGLVPAEPARGTFGGNAQGRRYGYRVFGDYFTPRQLVALTTFSELVGEAHDRVVADGGDRAYADAVSTYLAFAVDKAANYWSLMCAWHSGRDIIMSTFARQALPMVWDVAEANPFSSSSGNFPLVSTKRRTCCVRFRPASAAT